MTYGLLAAILTLALLHNVASTNESRAAIDSYRSWKLLTPEPRMVPLEIAFRCAIVADEEIEELKKQYGPHTARWIKVYGNAAAVAALADPNVHSFPPGAALVKEKLSTPDATEPAGIALMTKHLSSRFAENDGWQFVYRSSVAPSRALSEPRRATPAKNANPGYNGCVSCHRANGHKDYVIGRYGATNVLPAASMRTR